MSDVEQPQTPKKTLATRVADFSESATFFIFLAVLLLQNGVAFTLGAAWLVLHLGFLILWPGKFTFAFARSLGPDEDASVRDREPRTLSALLLVAMALGIAGVIDLFRTDRTFDIFVALGVSAAIGSLFFASVHLLDPLIRKPMQMVFLAVASLTWGLGVITGIGLLFYA